MGNDNESRIKSKVRSIARTAIFDWLKRLVSDEKYVIDMNQAARLTLGKLFEEGEISPRPPSNVNLEELSRNYNYKTLVNFITQTFWELHLQGILSPTPAWISTGNTLYNNGYKTVSAIIIPYGRELLAQDSNRIRVYDPDGYLYNFYNANPTPDPEMMRYLSECISVFRSNHLLASVVLLGVASERLIEVLAKSLRDALGDTEGTLWYSRYRNKDISKKFSSISNKFKDEFGEFDLNTDVFRAVELTFQYIRLARNDVAHPKDRRFTSNEVSGFIHNFVQYFKYINDIIAFLAKNLKKAS